MAPKKKSRKVDRAELHVDFIALEEAPVFAENEPMPILEEVAPLDDESAPLEDEPIPLEEEPMPLKEEPIPFEEELSPLEEELMLSPYASTSCYVYFKNNIPFVVPRELLLHAGNILSVSPILPGDGPNHIRMEEVPDDAGHVLVHYVYTGTWQILRQRHTQQQPTAFSDSNIGVTKSDFETSVHVYCAARAYGLSNLVELAKGQVQRLASHLTPLNVLLSASEACQLLAEDDLWFRGFLQRLLRLMFNNSKDLEESLFLGCIGQDTVYSKFLMRSLFRLCCQNCRVLPAAVGVPSAFEADETQSNAFQTEGDMPEEHDSIFLPEAGPSAEETKVAETPPSDDWTVAEEPKPEEFAERAESSGKCTETEVTDPGGFVPVSPPEACPQKESSLTEPTKKSKKDKKKQKKAKLLKRNESVLTENMVKLGSEPGTRPGPETRYEAETAIAPVEEGGYWGSRSVKENEKDGLASPILQAESVEEPGLRPALDDETGVDETSWERFIKKIDKNSGEVIAPEPEPEPKLEVAPAVEEGPCGEPRKPEKKKEKAIEVSKKKKKKAGLVPDASKPESGTEVDAETTTVRAEDPWGWGIPLPKKKSTAGQVIMPELDCPDRVTHILDGGWTECSTCREQVGNISGEYQATQAKEGDRLLF
ncbi:hypothetical protein CGCA056_v001565 [Colletotrichum aenigma]|uniref:uncharacterized protein n=1 Tax=Colletotrichum aenigma TaxID=1215731 RepID=UPI001872D315|nr:uncharacterized protein CGCA056_v001565 [Colletotrichum aenigma]KAF5527017.1 hypothetical protein CGCA056_v001565 [Colletotrichum aenigma]